MTGFFIALATTIALAATLATLGLMGRVQRDRGGAATSIFDDAEPLGRMTDGFPGARAEREAAVRP